MANEQSVKRKTYTVEGIDYEVIRPDRHCGWFQTVQRTGHPALVGCIQLMTSEALLSGSKFPSMRRSNKGVLA